VRLFLGERCEKLVFEQVWMRSRQVPKGAPGKVSTQRGADFFAL